jgi:hypothetical protein
MFGPSFRRVYVPNKLHRVEYAPNRAFNSIYEILRRDQKPAIKRISRIVLPQCNKTIAPKPRSSYDSGESGPHFAHAEMKNKLQAED